MSSIRLHPTLGNSSTRFLTSVPRQRQFGKSAGHGPSPWKSFDKSRYLSAREETNESVCGEEWVCRASGESPQSTKSSGEIIPYLLGRFPYQVVGVATVGLALAIIFGDTSVEEYFVGSKLRPVGNLLYNTIASLLATAAGACFCLQKAVAANRQDSDTYKRLAFGLVAGLTGVVITRLLYVKNGGSISTSAVVSQTIVELLPIVPFFYHYGLNTAVEIVSGVVDAIKSLFNVENVSSAVYAILTGGMMLWAVGMIGNPVAIASRMLKPTLNVLETSLLRGGGCMAIMMAMVCFTQKNGADRGRMGFSTFRNMNIALFLTGVAKLGTTTYIGKGMTQTAANNTGAVAKATKAATAVAKKAGALVTGEAENGVILTQAGWITIFLVFGVMALVAGYNAVTAKRE